MPNIVETHAPSAWTISNAMSTAMSVLARLRQDDATIETDEDALLAALRYEGADINDILRRLIRASLEAKASQTAATKRVQDLTARKKRYGLRAMAWRQAAFAIMEGLQMRRFIDAEFTATIGKGRASTEPPTIDIDLLPREYQIVEPDMKRIKEDLAEGVIIPGVTPAEGGGDNGAETIVIKQIRTK